MLVMRPAQMADLAEVQRLAADSPVGVTSLPDDAKVLGEKIAASEASFSAEVSFNGEESYFFVLEDSETGRLVGCSAIVASAGFSEPFYSFRNETFVHASRELKIHNKIHVLSLCHDLTGNSLLTSFYVERDLVNTPVAELNSRGRLLFMASHPERFADEVGSPIDFHQHGYLFLLSSPSSVDTFRKNVALQRSLGVDVSWLGADDVPRLAPGVNAAGVIAATFCARDGIADPNGVTMGFAKAAQAAGASIERDCEVIGIETSGGRVTKVRTSRGTIDTGVVVVRQEIRVDADARELDIGQHFDQRHFDRFVQFGQSHLVQLGQKNRVEP